MRAFERAGQPPFAVAGRRGARQPMKRQSKFNTHEVVWS